MIASTNFVRKIVYRYVRKTQNNITKCDFSINKDILFNELCLLFVTYKIIVVMKVYPLPFDYNKLIKFIFSIQT